MITFNIFSEIKDPRRSQGQRYEFNVFLTSILLAVLSGATSFRKISSFMELRRKQLNKLFGVCWNATPCYVAVRHLLLNLAPTELESALRRHSEWLRENNLSCTPTNKRFIAIDGKVLKGSAEKLEDKRAQQLLSVFEHYDQIVIGQWEVDEKTNEIPVAQQMIEELKLSGCIVTLDALHCQKNTGNRQSPGSRCVSPSEKQSTQIACRS